MNTISPRRSALYMPGSNARAMDKARALPADCIIFDLEDAVAPESKLMAREQVIAAVTAGGYGHREVIIRVNGLDTDWGAEDLRAIANAGADAVLLPKVEHVDTLEATFSLLTDAGAPAELPIWIMTETPRGVLNLDAIAAAQPRLQAIVMGTSDLAKEMRIKPTATRTGLLHALGHCVLTARAHGVDIIDGVHLELDDDEGLQLACQQGRQLGFDGKSLIHPRQLAAANENFGVSAEEAAGAQEIVAAWQAARTAGHGITVLRGRLIEQLHVTEAERIIALHSATLNN
jgi:citrate lyase subunit beta/citryl-CoA lyase